MMGGGGGGSHAVAGVEEGAIMLEGQMQKGLSEQVL